jgi:hypothetical protein
MATSKREIVNPRTGQRMIFLQTAHDTNGALFQVESFNPAHSPTDGEHTP